MAALSSMGKGDMVIALDQTVTQTIEKMTYWVAVDSGILPNIYRLFTSNSTRDGGTMFDQEDGDMYLLRGLAATFRLGGKLPADMQGTIKIILGVHYNAVRDYGQITKNIYGRSWSLGGSSSASFDMYNQAAAAQILVDGINLFDERSSSNPSTPGPTFSPSTPAPTPPPPSKSPAGMIVGVTVGSVVFVSILVIATFVLLHRHRWHRAASVSESTSRWISPFYGEKSGQTLPRGSHWHTKDRSGLPVSPELRGTGAGSAPLMVPAPSAQESPPQASESDKHRGDNMGHAEAVPDTSHEDGREGTATQMEMAPGFPDMVRAVYQRLWERDGSEAPPDYCSNAG
ncbi:hypothetical protein V5O48_015672 [Marasmius crinis-equi]|uniref:Receptor ligand binding region domain-containing protein n=1 Tax=Marasmius crinis-equi TaxID=585013 RepID=A0ABR3ETX9_9AGAR